MVFNLPYIVYGTVKLSGVGLSSATVYMRNERTGETINILTNSNGVYVLDAANLASGYEGTDNLTVFVLYQNYEGSGTASIASDEHEVNITVTAVVAPTTTSYCFVQDVWNELDGKTASDISASRIMTAILRAEELIDEKTGQVWKSTSIIEYYDFNQYNSYQSPESLELYGGTGVVRGDYGRFNSGRNKFRLNHYPVISITSLSRNLAGSNLADSWNALTEQSGSGGDFTVDLDTGCVDFITNVPRYGKRAVKVIYAYGRSTTPHLIQSLCTKLAAKDVIISKAFGSQFTSIDSIQIETIRITKGASNTVDFLNNLDKQINEIWDAVGQISIDIS